MKFYQKIAGLNCYCDIRGKGKPLILIHGWGQSHIFWQGFYQRFHENYAIYSFDLPGFGLSEEPKVVWGVED